MQTLERAIETKTLTAKDRKAIAALVKRSQAIGEIKKGDLAGSSGRAASNERAAIVHEVGRFLGYSFVANKHTAHDYQDWNNTVDWLDSYYPGWRGYTVTYPNGQIG